jgi:hypothetical protein
MLEAARYPENNSFIAEPRQMQAQPWQDHWDALAASAVLVLGSPRSGTTWLAKIFDSHPGVLYRHEPDQLTASEPGLPPEAQIRQWLLQRSLPTARLAARIDLPDMVAAHSWRQVRAVIKLVNWDATPAAQTMPDMRCVFILRHPCGQIASLMAGLRSRHVTAAEAAVDVDAAAVHAAGRGVSRAVFNALPKAAKFAWGWLAFNELAVESLSRLPNARIVLYEDLCRDPVAISRRLFTFAGLDWHPQADAFLGLSTSYRRGARYYDVFRATEETAERWRRTMSPQDQESVRAVVCTSPLARWWPDLAPPG